MTVIEGIGRNGLGFVRIRHETGSSAEVYLNGGHVTSWVADGKERLFIGSAAAFKKGEAIRGGIPVVFPQFAGEGPLPQHGFARKSQWKLAGAKHEGDVTRAMFSLSDDAATRALWPHGFRLLLTVAVGPSSLQVEMAVENTDSAPFDFTAAFHTYLRVADVRHMSLSGLGGSEYVDKTRGNAPMTDAAASLTVTEETDRVYPDVPRTLTLRDDGAHSTLEIVSTGFTDAVIWNPWREKATTFSGMTADDYLRMICVEAAQVGRPVSLAPRAVWTGSQLLRAVKG
jgi:glucose-6-phosphate 1-epimerase